MGTKVTGGGGAGGSGIISTGYVFNNADQIIAAGDAPVANLNQFTKKPTSSPDYSFVAGAGDGGPAIQINTHGMYLVTVSIPLKTSAAGDVIIAIDDPPYNCVMTSTLGEWYLSQTDTIYILNATSMFFTTKGLPIDILRVLVANNTLGTVTVLGFIASMTIMRLGDSPG